MTNTKDTTKALTRSQFPQAYDIAGGGRVYLIQDRRSFIFRRWVVEVDGRRLGFTKFADARATALGIVAQRQAKVVVPHVSGTGDSVERAEFAIRGGTCGCARCEGGAS